MNQLQSLPPEIWSLVDDLLNGSLSPEQAFKLDEALRDNPTAQQQFSKYCQLHIDLTIDHRADQAGKSFQAQSLLNDMQLPATPDSQKSEPISVPARLSLFAIKSSRLSLAASLLFVIALLAVVLAVRTGDRTQMAIEQKQALPNVIKLAAGSSTTLELEEVGHIHLEGPAVFRFLGPKRARLDSGRIRMRVTKQSGRGYIIETPDGDITDLGTEFGVDVALGRKSALAVFEGAVDLLVADQTAVVPRVERLLGGDGVLFNRGGQMDRLNSIMTGAGAKFEICGAPSSISFDDPLIVDVFDNLPADSTKRYYEIVTKGMREDSLAYVDRLQHNWNGLSLSSSLPRYLRNADYIKTFCDDKRRTEPEFQITVVLSRPAKLFVFHDRRLAVPDWLAKSFVKSDDRIGMDAGKRYSLTEKDTLASATGVGAGQSIDQDFDVWARKIEKPGPVQLGPNGVNRRMGQLSLMYGIVAAELPSATKKPKKRLAKADTEVHSN